MIRVQVVGLDLAIARMAALEAATAVAVEKTEDDAGDAVLERAETLVPVDTGALRDSLHAEDDPEGGVLVGTDIPYGPFVEFGTSIMAAQPFLRPAADEAGEDVEHGAVAAIEAAIRSVVGI